MRPVLFATVLCVAASLHPLFTAVAQPAPARVTVHGAIRDATKTPIAGAVVTVATEGPTPPTSTTTNERGEFELSLPPGHYAVTATADGFVTFTQQLSLSSADTSVPDFVLQVAGIRDTVTVRGVGPYTSPVITTATKAPTLLRDVPQSVTVVTRELIQDQLMMSVGDVMRYVPGVSVHQGENNRDQIIVRGNSSSADFYIDGVRDDVQYYRDLYNTERIEALKGPNAMIFGRGGAGGVVNRVMKDARFQPLGEFSLQGGMYGNKRVTADFGRPLNEKVAFRVNGMFEDSGSFRNEVTLNRKGITPTVTFTPDRATTITARYEYLDDSRVADRGITSYHGRPANVPDDTFYGDPDQSDVQATVHLASGLIEHRRGAMTVRNHTMIGGYDRFYQNFVPGAVTPNMSQLTVTSYNNATRRTNFFNQTDVTYAAATGSVGHTLLAGSEFGRQGTNNFRNTGFFDNTATTLLVPFSAPTIRTPVTFRQSASDPTITSTPG
jgi:catecholate siderophore receptor